MSSQSNILIQNINGIIDFQQIFSIYTGNLVINLDSTVGISGNTWTDQTGNGFNYTYYDNSNNIGTTNNGVNVNTVTINGYKAVLLDGSGNFLWRNNTNGFGSNIFTSSFTYEMWVFPLITQNATLIYEDGQNSFNTGFFDDQMGLNSSGYITSYVYKSGDSKPGLYVGNGNSSSAYFINNWYQIVNVYDNTSQILYQYVNGVLSAQVTVTRIPPTSSKVWLLLGSNTSNSSSYMGDIGYFCGCIGSFRGYNIALSSSQILQNYYAYNLTRYIKYNTSFNTTGGTKTNNGLYIIHTFTNTSASTSFVLTGKPITANYLIVGGGGIGGNTTGGAGGGGGAGGCLLGSIGLNIGSYTITVGQGATSFGTIGGNSSIVGPAGAVTVSLNAYGGGPGGNDTVIVPTVTPVGSGGGASCNTNNYSGENGTSGQGYNGGKGNYYIDANFRHFWYGGGGGGAGGNGGNGSNSTSGTGGNPIKINTTNLPGYNPPIYICGGGGGGNYESTGGSGGTVPGTQYKGGNLDSIYCGGDGAITGYSNTAAPASNGKTYGSGGGGGASTTYPQGNGYQGVVIITYNLSSLLS